MKLKLALATVIGLLVGAVTGGYLGHVASQWFVEVIYSSRLDTRLVDHVLWLKLLDEGKTESLRQALLADVQVDTIAAESLDLTSSPNSGISESRRRLLRFARMSGELKSVREDTSELGKEAAKARSVFPRSLDQRPREIAYRSKDIASAL
jgi:hypothetical protein